MKVEESIQQWMINQKKTLALAESVTGGQVAARLTKVPGASHYFLGSLVVYSNGLKEKLLHVSEKTIKQAGTVGAEAVKEMAEQLIRVTGADFGIAISGIAGPTGGTAQKPIGTIWAALIEKGQVPHVWNFHLSGSREKIILDATEHVLVALYSHLSRY
ncbi:MAG TPA: CinA family protein [Rhabdochlamydiaceae bacterium]|nr:CinA family protein [Rhabdochlamydiaceae bacterium]